MKGLNGLFESVWKALDKRFGGGEREIISSMDKEIQLKEGEIVELEDRIGELTEELSVFREKYNQLNKDHQILKLTTSKPSDEPGGIKVVKHINKEVVRNLLRRNFPKAQIFIADDRIGLLTMNQVKGFLYFDRTEKETYVKQSHDCDDSSLELYTRVKWWAGKGNISFGMLWIDKPTPHAVNVVITDDMKVKCVEPQSDKIYAIPKDYEAKMVMV